MSQCGCGKACYGATNPTNSWSAQGLPSTVCKRGLHCGGSYCISAAPACLSDIQDNEEWTGVLLYNLNTWTPLSSNVAAHRFWFQDSRARPTDNRLCCSCKFRCSRQYMFPYCMLPLVAEVVVCLCARGVCPGRLRCFGFRQPAYQNAPSLGGMVLQRTGWPAQGFRKTPRIIVCIRPPYSQEKSRRIGRGMPTRRLVKKTVAASSIVLGYPKEAER
jgi:hypothetical protein